MQVYEKFPLTASDCSSGYAKTLRVRIWAFVVVQPTESLSPLDCDTKGTATATAGAITCLIGSAYPALRLSS